MVCQARVSHPRTCLVSLSRRKLSRAYSQRSEENVHIIRDRKIHRISVEQFVRLSQAYEKVHIDIGAGDGKYIYRQAKLNPKTFFIGMDSNPEMMSGIAWRASRKPEKGGIQNISFLHLAVEDIPSSFPPLAHHVTVLYPWAKLLKDVSIPSESTLKKITQILKPKAEVVIAINYTVFDNNEYVQKLGLPKLDNDYLQNILEPRYKKFSLRLKKQAIDNSPEGTTWGNHLGIASGRKTLLLKWVYSPKINDRNEKGISHALAKI